MGVPQSWRWMPVKVALYARVSRGFRLHDLRHLQATYLNAQRVDPRHIADRLGHSRASFTQDRYVHVDPRGQEQAAAIANELLMKTGVLN